MSPPYVIGHHDAGLLAKAVAARLVTKLVDIQAAAGSPSLVLTGGGIGTAVLAELAVAPARDAVDWRHLDIWWGDERFLPSGDPERNEAAAQQALLQYLDSGPGRVHRMPGTDGPDPEAAAARYAAELRAAARPEDHGPVPGFDVLLLGIGPEGHVASLFPAMPALYDDRSVVAVRGAPKPPPIRLTLTLPSIRSAREVWILAAGPEKAGAVRLALSDVGPVQVPAAGNAPCSCWAGARQDGCRRSSAGSPLPERSRALRSPARRSIPFAWCGRVLPLRSRRASTPPGRGPPRPSCRVRRRRPRRPGHRGTGHHLRRGSHGFAALPGAGPGAPHRPPAPGADHRAGGTGRRRLHRRAGAVGPLPGPAAPG